MINQISHIWRNLILISWIALLSANAIAQSVQKGIILEYNGKDAKTPIANVEIVVNNAGSTVSNKKGEFNLTFRTLKPGDKVAIRRIVKAGYEVFNKDALEQWYISKDNTPFEIVMCRSDVFKQLRDNYSNVARTSYTIKFENEQLQLKQSLDKGAIEQNVYQQKLKALQDQYESQLDNIENYIDKFARIDLSELEAFEKDVINLVAKGEIDLAIQRYEDENLLTKYKKQVDVFYALENATKKVTDAIESSIERRDSLLRVIKHQVVLLRMAGGKKNFDRAMNLMHDVALSDTTNFGAAYEYAFYCQKIFRLDEALNFFRIGLRNAAPVSHEAVQARIGISKVLLNKKEYYEIEETVTPIIEIIDELANKAGNPNLYIRERVDAKNVLARACAQLHDSVNAIKYYNEAMADAETIVSMDSEQIGVLAEIESMASIMYSTTFILPEEAIEIGKRALEHTQELYNSNPQLYKARLAFTQNVMGKAYEANEDLQMAETHYLEADRLYAEAYKINPEAYIKYLANNKQNLALLYLELGNSESKRNSKKAIAPLREAENLYNIMVNTYKMTNLELNIALIHNNYCRLYYQLGQNEKALYYGNLAYKESQPFFERYPSTYHKTEVAMLNNIYNCYDALARHKEATGMLDKLYDLTKDDQYLQAKQAHNK